jgi:putative tryptophan/tyrosine transport system substrate-binding protein
MNRPPSPLSMLFSRHTRRREFIAGLGGAATWPLVALAQQAAVAIGWLDQRPAAAPRDFADAFREGLKEMSFAEGRNVSIISRYAQGRVEQLPALAADLVRQKVAVIIAPTGAAAVAAEAATQTIPVVFVMGGDPVEVGVVASLNRPGSNVTGINVRSTDISGKCLELLSKLVPAAERIALLSSGSPGRSLTSFSEAETEAIESAANALGVRLLVLRASAASMSADLAAAFNAMVEQRVGALLVSGSVTLDAARDQIISLAARYAIPTMFFFGTAAVAGGLMSYGSDTRDANRQAGVYVGRILKGEKPADLPVVRSDKFELILKTAKALGRTVPPNLLAIADEVIE